MDTKKNPYPASAVSNFRAGYARASGPGCVGCRATGADVMLSFGYPEPYGGDNRPSGPEEKYRVVDVFLDREAARVLRDELDEVLAGVAT